MATLRTLSRWASSIGTRVLAVNLVVLMVPVFGVEFARTYERQLLRSLERDMRNQAELVRVDLQEDARQYLPAVEQGEAAQPISSESLQLLMTEMQVRLVRAAERTRTRIRLIAREGPRAQVMADSHANGPPEGQESIPETPEPERVLRRVGRSHAQV